jgi:hypothetical protein
MAYLVKDANNTTRNVPQYDTAYSASLLAFAPAITTAATDCQLVTMIGVAATIARVKRVLVVPRLTTLAFNVLRLERWSTLGTIGSAVATAIPTQARHGSPGTLGSVPGAPGLVVSSIGTAAYTTAGTTTGIFMQRHVIAKSTTAVDSAPDVFEFKVGDKGDNPIEVNGTTDVIALITKPPATATGAVFDIYLEWEESIVS